jgi:hypothetical protein
MGHQSGDEKAKQTEEVIKEANEKCKGIKPDPSKIIIVNNG